MTQINKSRASQQSQVNLELTKRAELHGIAFKSMDYMTVLGIAISLTIIGTVIYLGGSVQSFIDMRSILIVFGGTFTITMIAFSWKDLKITAGILWQTISKQHVLPQNAAYQILIYAEYARRNGLISLEKFLDNVDKRSFLYKGLELVSDGTDVKEVENILTTEIYTQAQQNFKSAEVTQRAADAAPAMGLIGTLIGLVQMLANLEDPSQIGPSMAVAIITTFYGTVLGSMFLAPLAAKLERNASEDELVLQIRLAGFLSIARRENPRKLETLINTILPSHLRIQYFTN